MEFDFLGKDSIRYQNRVPVDRQVFKNLKLFIKGKKPEDDLFDRLNVSWMSAVCSGGNGVGGREGRCVRVTFCWSSLPVDLSPEQAPSGPHGGAHSQGVNICTYISKCASVCVDTQECVIVKCGCFVCTYVGMHLSSVSTYVRSGGVMVLFPFVIAGVQDIQCLQHPAGAAGTAHRW